MAQEARQERHHGCGHAGHFDEQTEEDEQRHGEKNEMAHALVHAADQHHERRMGREREIAEDREPEGEGDRHAGENRGRDHADKEDQKIEIAELEEDRPRGEEQRDDHGHSTERGKHGQRRTAAQQPQQRKDDHQRDAGRHGRGAPSVGDFERGRRDRQLIDGVLIGRPGDQEKKGQRRAAGERIERRPPWRRQQPRRRRSCACARRGETQ